MLLSQPAFSRTRKISITPLIDIVFILLLFFILETNFLGLGELALKLPSQQQGSHTLQETLQIQAFSDGRIWLQGQSLELAELPGFIASQAYPADTPVLLKVEDRVQVQRIVDLVDLLLQSGLQAPQIQRLDP